MGLRSAYDEDPSGKRSKRGARRDTPYLPIFLLLVTGSIALYTRQKSLDDTEAVSAAARILKEETPTADEVTFEPVEDNTGIIYRKDPEIEASARATFNPTHHSLYNDLPPLPHLTEEQLTGSWKYTDAVYDYAANHPAAEVVSWEKPRAVVFKSFLTPEEVGHMIAVAKDNLERSHVLSTEDKEEIDDARTSYGAWPPNDDVLEAINDRIHRLLAIPKEFGESLYILNYQLGQKYDAHNDNCVDWTSGALPQYPDEACMGFLRRAGGPDCGPSGGGDSCGDRIATFILHLAAPEKGGRTVFPKAAITTERSIQYDKDENDDPETWYCEKDYVLGVAPNPGDATLFYDYIPVGGPGRGSYNNGTAEPAAHPVLEALHSGCPVQMGEKWIATRWIRSARFI